MRTAPALTYLHPTEFTNLEAFERDLDRIDDTLFAALDTSEDRIKDTLGALDLGCLKLDPVAVAVRLELTRQYLQDVVSRYLPNRVVSLVSYQSTPSDPLEYHWTVSEHGFVEMQGADARELINHVRCYLDVLHKRY